MRGASPFGGPIRNGVVSWYGPDVPNKEHYLVPVLVGGVLAGVLSSVPIVAVVNCLFCAWMLLGAGLAVKLVQDKAKNVQMGEAALIGALAGAVCAGVCFVIQAGINIAMGPSTVIPPQLESQLPPAMRGGGSLAMILAISCVVLFVIYPLFGALGGLLGGLIFKPSVPPGGDDAGFGPPAGGFGQPPGGGFGPPP